MICLIAQRFIRDIRRACLLLCFLVPVNATAQQSPSAFSGEVTIGLGYVSEDAFKFGEYNGLQDDGLFAIGGIDLASTFAYDGASANYWSIRGENLGLETRDIEARFGQQGTADGFFRYRQIQHYRINSARNPFIGAGSADQTLPADWVGSNTTGGLRNLFASLNKREIKTEREQFGGGLSWLFAKNWSISGNYQHEKKDGVEPMGAIFGTNGGNPRGAVLVAPIDYTNDTLDLSLAYAGHKTQLALAYHLSLFNNDDEALTWDNPFLRLPFGNTWARGTDFAAGARGQIARAPDNQSHQVVFTGGHRIGQSTRVTANVAYGWMTQNETFLPASINPNLVTTGLQRNSLEGRIETTYVNVGFSTRPSRKFDIRGHYIYDDQDNETPRNIYQLAVNDSAAQGGLVSSNARINTPYSSTSHRASIDANYRIRPTTKLTFGYDFAHRDRDFTEVRTTDEHTGRVKLWSSLASWINGWMEYSHAERDGSQYVSNHPFLSGHNPSYIATLSPQQRFINDPLLRKFNYADRDRDTFSATVNVAPTDKVTFSINGKYGQDDYKQARLGLQERDDASVTLDVAYTPHKRLTTYAFVTHERLIYEQDGYQRAAVGLFPGFNRTPSPCASCGFWNVETDDEINTFGIGSKWSAIDDKLKMKFDYTFSRSVTDTTPSAEPNVTFLPLPEIRSRLHNLSLSGEYQFADNLALKLRYMYERLEINNFAEDGVGPDTLANIISLGDGSIDYAAHVIGVSLAFTFR